ncbi:MAG: NAD(P)/FAD-dependent oxidoreductase [Bdellovibrionales bacterium]
MQRYDAIILGAGAAGLMCALRAGQRGRKVLLLDHATEAGPKILISGGGRCNFTNRHAAPDRFISGNPHFCISALKGYTQHDFIGLVEKHKIAYHEKTLGQLFCDGSAREIIAMLLDECRTGGVDIRLGQKITDIAKADAFRIMAGGEAVEARNLVLATGGLSIPKLGASGFTHEAAARFGIPLTELRPALVPLVFDGEELAMMRALAGVSLEVLAVSGKATFREAMVFTHKGLSGPAILQISSYWCEGQNIELDLLPGTDAKSFLLDRKKSRGKSELQTILGEVLPQRLAQSLTEKYFTAAPMVTLTDKYLRDAAVRLKRWHLTPAGTEGYAKAEVTRGGVDTTALSSKTMEVKSVPGLYIIGEAVDVTGWLGGYNFQWAWSSGWAAGSAV